MISYYEIVSILNPAQKFSVDQIFCSFRLLVKRDKKKNNYYKL